MYEWTCRAKAGTLRYTKKAVHAEEGGDSDTGKGASAVDAGRVEGVPSRAQSQSRATSAPVGVRTGAGADILKLFMTKAPKRMQAHVCWLDTVVDDATFDAVAFDAAVDARLEELTRKAVSEKTATPPRQAAKASVAAELYKNLDEDTKKRVADKVAEAHKESMKSWLARKSEEAESPEDAAQWVTPIVIMSTGV